MSCPRAASSMRVGTAKSGVPMKIRRSGIFRPKVSTSHGRACPGHPRLSYSESAKTWMPGTRPGMTKKGSNSADMMRRLLVLGQRLGARGLFRGLLELLQYHVALELGDMVDEQHTIDVINLVLQAGRQQAIGLDLLRLEVEVEKLDLHRLRPLDLLVVFGDRQAALLVDRFLVRCPDHFRIDEDLRLLR